MLLVLNKMVVRPSIHPSIYCPAHWRSWFSIILYSMYLVYAVLEFSVCAILLVRQAFFLSISIFFCLLSFLLLQCTSSLPHCRTYPMNLDCPFFLTFCYCLSHLSSLFQDHLIWFWKVYEPREFGANHAQASSKERETTAVVPHKIKMVIKNI